MNAANAILVKSNRILGAQLLELGLIDHPSLEEANERFIDSLQGPGVGRTNLLSLLLYDIKTLDESVLIQRQIEDFALSPLPLQALSFAPDEWGVVSAEIAFATSTIPVDRVGSIWFLATSYFLSRPVREYWESFDPGITIIWLCARHQEVQERIEQLAAYQAKVETRNATRPPASDPKILGRFLEEG